MSRFYGKKPEPVVQLPPHTIEVVAASAPEPSEVIEDAEPEEIEPFVEWPEDSENDS